MIKAQAFKEPQRQSQPSRQDYVFEEKQKGNFGPFAFLAVLTGFAVYLKSFLATASEPAPEQRKSSSQKAADDAIVQGSADDGPATEVSQEEKDAAGDTSENVVPMTPRRLITQDMLDSFLASDSPPLNFTPPKSIPPARSDSSPPANDNHSGVKALSGREIEAASRMGHGGGGDPQDNGVPPRLLDGPRQKALEIGGSPDTVPLQPPAGTTPHNSPSTEGPSDRNRAPRTNGAVNLPDLVGCQAYFIPLLALLAGASDADGDQLRVLGLKATSGTLAPVEGGWMYMAERGDPREVVFSFAIGDGIASVEQLAYLRMVDPPPIIGTDGDDNLLGTTCGEIIDARDGHDNIDARQGNDIVLAGNGDDHVVAGDGNDVVQAGTGNDIVFAGAGNDVVFGGSGDDRLFGEAGDDTIFGEEGNDAISGGAGDDILLAGIGDDVVHGDAGNDVLDGGEGADTLYGDAGNDVLDGGEGTDSLHGGEGDDTMIAGAGDDTLMGDEGADVLADGLGNDTVYGGTGDDHLTAAADAAPDTYEGGSGEDTLDYSSAFLDIFVDVGAGTADGREIGRDFIAGFERIIGGQGNDHLVSGSEPIQMAGGEGDDTFEFKSSDDDHQPDLVRKITDFTYGDRIIAARYEIFYRTDEGAEEQVGDLFEDIYLSENSDRRPIRFRFEQLDNGDLTFVDVHDRPDSEEFYSIELAGHHNLQFTVVVS